MVIFYMSIYQVQGLWNSSWCCATSQFK